MPLSCRNPIEPDHLTARERRLALTRPTTSIAHRLVEAREAAGLSQAEAARLAAVSLKTLKAWETGKTSPRPNKLQMLSGVLSVPLLWLLGGGEQYEPVDTRTSRLDMLEQKVSRLPDCWPVPTGAVWRWPQSISCTASPSHPSVLGRLAIRFRRLPRWPCSLRSISLPSRSMA